MAFNSDTYHANKYRKSAWARLAEARQIKAAGPHPLYGWRNAAWVAERVSLLVALARSDLSISRSYAAEARRRRESRETIIGTPAQRRKARRAIRAGDTP